VRYIVSTDSALLKIDSPGMHLLEMAKTAWNAIVTGANSDDARPEVSDDRLKNELRVYLCRCQEILRIFGREGDTPGGPLEEMQTLQGLLEDG